MQGSLRKKRALTGVKLRVTANCNRGKRMHMEDRYSIAQQPNHDRTDLEYVFLGIFDGHGGHEAADFAKENLMRSIVSASEFWSDDDEDVLNAIRKGFMVTHFAMAKVVADWPKLEDGLPSNSGTTASVAFIRRGKIFIGHVGDSGIVLGREGAGEDTWEAVPLTKEHKPDSDDELARIVSAGGEVMRRSKVARVVWEKPVTYSDEPFTTSSETFKIPYMAVARSLGDFWSYNAISKQFLVSPEPDVSVHSLDLDKDHCLILGTDGLFNIISADEAVEAVQEADQYNKDGKASNWMNPAAYLVSFAMESWRVSCRRADNTSAVVVFLDPPSCSKPNVISMVKDNPHCEDAESQTDL